MIENRNINIITDADGKKLVLINDIRFKGKRQNVFLLEVICRKSTQNQRAGKALWVRMQRPKPTPPLQYRN